MHRADHESQPSGERRAPIDALNEQAWALKDQDPERSRALAGQVQALALDDPPYEEGIASSRLLLSVLAWDRSDYPEALTLAFEAHAIFIKTGNLRQQAAALSQVARLNRRAAGLVIRHAQAAIGRHIHTINIAVQFDAICVERRLTFKAKGLLVISWRVT